MLITPQGGVLWAGADPSIVVVGAGERYLTDVFKTQCKHTLLSTRDRDINRCSEGYPNSGFTLCRCSNT